VSAIFSQALQFPRGLQQLDVFQSIFVIFLKFEMMLFRSLITLSLAFVQAYPHASSVIQSLGESDINVNLLVQVDKLVRLLETPIFSYLRLQLLEPARYPQLLKTLYGLLMLLPQVISS
jgi:vacuole morphology and inheritance protein 14